MITRYRRKRKYLLLILMFGVLTMSIGFSAFSSELVIASSASVKPDSSAFRVVFSSSGTQLLTNKVNGTATGDAKAGSATIENGGDTPRISDLTATFSGSGETVKYEFYVYNSGAYVAYLRDITFKNVSGKSSSKVCSAIDAGSSSNELIDEACNAINISVDVGSTVSVMSSTSGISNRSLNKGVFEKVVVTISYSDSGTRADEDFKVEFGDIGLTYSTVDYQERRVIYFSVTDVNDADMYFQAEEGMTWGEWINSDYNSSGFYLDEICGVEYVVYNGDYFEGLTNSNDVIMEYDLYSLMNGIVPNPFAC